MKKNSDPTISSVAGTSKAGKYLSIAAIAALGLILAQGFFPHRAAKTTEQEQAPIAIADNNATPINLNFAVNPPPPKVLPLPVQKILPPPPPPSILTADEVNRALGGSEDDQNRLKSPTQVYAAEQSAPNSAQNILSAGGNANSSFAQQASTATVLTVEAKKETHMDYKILQGKFITAILETSINSDLPGMVRAVVSKDIYSDTGKFILFPRGTRLIGLYNSGLVVGQTRVMIVWSRAITPQHLDIALGSPNADNLGQAGMGGQVDSHFWQIFGTSAVLSVLGVAASNTNPGSSSGEAGVTGNPYQASVAQGVMNASNNVLQGRINIQPTIRVPQGSPVEVFVARDLDFTQSMQASSL